MFIILGALLAGNFLGLFVRSAPWAYALCFPAGVAVYFLLKVLPTIFHDTGIKVPDLETSLTFGALHVPLLLLGVYLARQKFNRR